jgi:chromate transporter
MTDEQNVVPHSETVSPLPATTDPSPSLWLFFRVWFALSMQSFGGGPATLTLIRRAMVEQRPWIPDAEFSRYWALVQVAPGINLLALTILIGRRVRGGPGIAIALLGLLLPSVAMTVLITYYYAQIRRATLVQAALAGVLPATVGMGMLTAIGMARPLLAAGRREGTGSLALCLALLIGSGAAVALLHWPVVLVLLAAGGLGAAAGMIQNRGRARG